MEFEIKKMSCLLTNERYVRHVVDLFQRSEGEEGGFKSLPYLQGY